VAKDVMLETRDQSSDSFSASHIFLLYCPKHHAVEQQEGKVGLAIIQARQNIPKTRIQDFRIAMKKFTLVEGDRVINRR